MSAHPRISVPDFDSVWAKVQPSAQQISQNTNWMTTWNKKSIALMIPVFLGLLIFLVALLAFFTGNPGFGVVALIVAVILAGPSVVYSMRKMTEATTEHSQTVVAPMIEELIEHMSANTISDDEARLQATYDPKGKMPSSVLTTAGFIRDSHAQQEDFIKGTFGQTDFMLTDMKWQTSEVEMSEEAKQRKERRLERERKRDRLERDRDLKREHGDDWRIHRRIEDYREQRRSQNPTQLTDYLPESWVNGAKEKYKAFEESTQAMGPSMVIFAADFHKEFSSKTYLLPREHEDQAIRNFTPASAAQGGLEPMVLEDPIITKMFRGWTTDQVEARYLITPELMLAITDAAERMESQRIAVSFRGTRMYFAVVLDEDRFSLGLAGDDDGGYSVAKTIYEDLVAFLSLIEHFNLNTRIWSKV